MKLAAVGVTVGSPGRRRLDHVTVGLDPQVPTLLVGPNGAGKSTLLRVLAGLDSPAAGRVELGGRPFADHPRRERAAAVAWLPQHPRLEEGLTAIELVAAARYRFREAQPEALAAAQRALHEVGAEDLALRSMATLSGGEAQRVRLGALQAQGAAWWLLDEPFNHLDPGVRLALLEVVRRRGGAWVLVTHDLTLVPWLPEARVLALRQGRVVHDGPADDPDLPGILGPLLGVRLKAVDAEGARRFVVAGRA